MCYQHRLFSTPSTVPSALPSFGTVEGVEDGFVLGTEDGCVLGINDGIDVQDPHGRIYLRSRSFHVHNMFTIYNTK